MLIITSAFIALLSAYGLYRCVICLSRLNIVLVIVGAILALFCGNLTHEGSMVAILFLAILYIGSLLVGNEYRRNHNNLE